MRKTIRLRWLLCWLCLLIAVQESPAQENVNLYQRPQREVGITDEFTTPLSSRLGTFVTFVYVVCALLSVVGGLRIFSRWQAGNTDITGDIWRWGLAIITVLLLVTVLSELASNNATGPVNITKTDFNR